MGLPQSSLFAAARVGLIGGAGAVLMALVGAVVTLNHRFLIAGLLPVGLALLYLLIAVVGSAAARQTRATGPRAGAVAGGLAGAAAGAVLALLVALGGAVNLREILANASPMLFSALTFGRAGAVGLLLPVAAAAITGGVAGLIVNASDRVRGPLGAGLSAILLGGLFNDLIAGIFRGLAVPDEVLGFVFGFSGLTPLGALLLFSGAAVGAARGGAWRARARRRMASLPPAQQRLARTGFIVAGVLLVIALPMIVGSFLSYVLILVGLYSLMGLGLNLEMGWAGLLDLGFVAFFAIAAYTVAMLTSPELGWASLTFWQALPVAVVMALLAGVLFGVPVLGVRGDYLAIATLGFGEIVRLLALSDFLRPFTGGAQGIVGIPRPVVFGKELIEPQHLFYIVIATCVLFLFVANRLRHSRLGRAWTAMREDEDVAQAMGINLVQTKLLAYGLGAAFAGIAGAIFGSMLGSVYPHSMDLLISINVLALIIVGGMGSMPGVFVGAMALVGLPELLREFSEFRLLIYGLLLIVMMLLKPEGFLPEQTIRRELVEEAAPAEIPTGAGTTAAPGAR